MTYASSPRDFGFSDFPPRLPDNQCFVIWAPLHFDFRIDVLEVQVDLTDSRFHFEFADGLQHYDHGRAAPLAS